MTGKPSVLVLTSTFPRWEGDSDPPFVFDLCRRLERNFVLHVLSPHCSGCKKEELFRGLHVTRFRYFFRFGECLAYDGGILPKLKRNPLLYFLIPFFFIGQLLGTIRLLQRYRVDLIHAHWVLPQGLIAILAQRIINKPVPVLCTSHGGDIYGLRGGFFKRLSRFVFRHCAAVTVVSRAMRRDVLDIGGPDTPVRVIPMGVDLTRRFVPLAVRQPSGTILFVGRLVEKKGTADLIAAMPQILERHPGCRLVIAGDGPERIRLTRQSRSIGLEERVSFMGSVKNSHLPDLYRSADIVVFPSVVARSGDREGFGLVPVEALGCECAVVITDLPAMNDIVEHGKTGMVVPQRAPRSIAEKVVYLLDHPELRRNLGREGRRYVLDHFDWTVIGEKYRILLESIS